VTATEADEERVAERAAALLSRPGAWLAALGGGYAVRLGGDGRRRPALRLNEAAFRRLARDPGLALRAEGGWKLPRGASAGPSAGRSLEGSATTESLGPPRPVRGEGALAWLARRKDSEGRPWLTPAELAAGERLQGDWERSGTLGRLTMSWDAGPKSGGSRGPGADPLEHGRAARARVRAALNAVDPESRRMLEAVCLRGCGLGATEAVLRLPRRFGRTLLKRGLGQLARHYRLG
jgi:hypothetical protein